MSTPYNLEQIAYDYLKTGSSTQSLKEGMVRAGSASVPALFRAALRRTEEIGEEYSPMMRTISMGTAGSVLMIETVKMLVGSIPTNMNNVIAGVGQSGMDEVCNALFNAEKNFVLLACLVLLDRKNHTWQTMRKVAEAYQFFHAKRHPVGWLNLRAIELLTVLYAQEREEQAVKLIEDAARKEGVSTEEWQDSMKTNAYMALIEV